MEDYQEIIKIIPKIMNQYQYISCGKIISLISIILVILIPNH